MKLFAILYTNETNYEYSNVLKVLLDAGADIDIETPAPGPSFPGAHPVARYWTALTFACCLGRTSLAAVLLERGACVEGGAGIAEDRGALTPLQVRSIIKYILILFVIYILPKTGCLRLWTSGYCINASSTWSQFLFIDIANRYIMLFGVCSKRMLQVIN